MRTSNNRIPPLSRLEYLFKTYKIIYESIDKKLFVVTCYRKGRVIGEHIVGGRQVTSLKYATFLLKKDIRNKEKKINHASVKTTG